MKYFKYILNGCLLSTFNTKDGNFVSRNRSFSEELRKAKVSELDLNYKRKFKQKDSKLFANITTSYDNDKENTNIDTQNLTTHDQNSGAPNLQRTRFYEDSNITSLRLVTSPSTSSIPSGCNYLVALPVTLTSFDVYKSSNTSLIRWATASEINNEEFFVQRITDTKYWVDIDFVKGNGNLSKNIPYSSIDYSPAAGINYYRLGQKDFDGKMTYSDIKSVRFTKGNGTFLFPNPTKGLLSLEFDL